MALILADRVRETSTTTGSGALTLAGAVTGYQTFSAAIGNANTCYYAISNPGIAEWEVGIGTYATAGNTLTRTTVLKSSNANAAVVFSAGTKDVFVTYPATKSVYLDASGNASGLGTPAAFVATNVTGLPISTGVSGLGANVATALAVAVGSAGAPVVNGGVLGTPSSGTLTNCTFPTLNQNTSGTAAGLSATLVATSGGTGQSSYAIGDILYASTTTALSKLADVATGNAVISGGVGTAPSWGKVGLTTHVSGTLPIANGGTNGTATPTAGTIPYGTGTTLAYTAVGTSGQVLTSAAAGVPTWTTPTTGTVTSVTGTAPVASSGGATPAISMAAATTSVSGYLTSTDWNTFNGKQAAGSYVTVGGALGTPSSGTLTNCTFPTLNQNTTGSSASCTGNAATATTATNQSGGTVSATTGTFSSTLTVGGAIVRNAAGVGYLNGNYPSSDSSTTSGCIYSIGGAYVPGTTTLGNMYGIGYGYSTVSGGTSGVPVNQWGLYVASAGTGRIFLDSDNGRGYFASNLYVNGGTQVVYNSGTWSINVSGNAATATTASNSNTVGGYTPSATAGTANRVVLADASGYIFNSYFNSTDNVQSASMTYVMGKFGDNYLRSGTAACVATFLSGQTMNISGSSTSCTGNAATATTATTATNQSGGTVSATTGTFSSTLSFNSGYGSSVAAYGCRVWVNFNGTSGAIRASGGVSSVTYNAAGNYRVNFTNTMPDVNYAPVVMLGSTRSTSTGGATAQTQEIAWGASTTSYFTFYNGLAYDPYSLAAADYFTVVVVR